MDEHRHTNHLATETSPYLLQHAHNPVEWYPWGDAALERARSEDKPILLSIGYSACHWCHVMERESFEDESMAELMNRHFVNIKVDREERPDLDQIYMSAVQLMSGSGGWPLTVFLTPDGKPFYGGTYFPPDDQYGRPGFRRVLNAIAEAYRDRRNDVASNARKVIEQIQSQANRRSGSGRIDLPLLERASDGIASQFDARYGGFGQAPKFPSSMTLDFLLRQHARTGDAPTLDMVTLTLRKMALGGLYDQVGGGFHRYSTDEAWLVPHFEKMLYDNALLARIYLDAFRVTGDPLFRRVVEETLDFVVREMRDPNGGFYSTLDADSEGVEGKFYVWDRAEFDEVIGRDSGLLARFLDVTDRGNFEGSNILNMPLPPEEFAASESIETAVLSTAFDAARGRLFERRRGRIHPGRDDKILTDWNGLMLAAFADAAAYLGRDDYRVVAETSATFILDTMWDGQRLLHSFKDGRARFNAYIDDYANIVDGLFRLYELTFEERWIIRAVELSDHMVEEFWDDENGGFFFTADHHETLIARTKEFFDNATPSGNSVAADVLARLGSLMDRNDFRVKSERICGLVRDFIGQFPSGFGRTLAAADYLIGPSREVAIVGGGEAFIRTLRQHYMPRTVVAAGENSNIALLRNRPALDGKPTAYVCENQVCHNPTSECGEFERQLRAE